MAPTKRTDAGRTSRDGGSGAEAMGELAAPGGAPCLDTESESDRQRSRKKARGKAGQDHASQRSAFRYGATTVLTRVSAASTPPRTVLLPRIVATKLTLRKLKADVLPHPGRPIR